MSTDEHEPKTEEEDDAPTTAQKVKGWALLIAIFVVVGSLWGMVVLRDRGGANPAADAGATSVDAGASKPAP